MDDNHGEAQLLNLTQSNDITKFFYDAIKTAQNSSEIQLSENVEFYLVQLLSDFIRIGNHTALNECLVSLLQKALESVPTEQIALYKKLADNALYYSGFYQEYFSNKSFSIKYYISMGQSAYHKLAGLMNTQNTYQKTMSTIYQEMSDSFLDSVDVLLSVSEQTQQTKSSRSTLNIYETWIDTESQKLERDLLEKGIIPLPNLIKKVQ